MNTEKLHINGFAGITEAEIELSRINIFIGPQASGKSICVKLFFFFRQLIDSIPVHVLDQNTKNNIRLGDKNDFIKYFPPSGWGSGVFSIQYTSGDLWIRVVRPSNTSPTTEISYSPLYDTILRRARQAFNKLSQSDTSSSRVHSPEAESLTRQFYGEYYRMLPNTLSTSLFNRNSFIPAGRSFFSVLQRSVWRLLANDVEIDPFMALFGSSYEHTREAYVRAINGGAKENSGIEHYISRLIHGNYLRVRARDFIVAVDGRRIPLETSSSGQQEALPLALTLAAMAYGDYPHLNTVIIEEPEAHLYPSSQRDIVHLLAMVADSSAGSLGGQFLVTTHSPYILSALNNLMYGGKIINESPDKKDCVSAVLDNAAVIDPSVVRAYSLSGGTIHSIIDKDTGLVEATMLDGVSNELAAEFDSLINIAYGE